MATWSSRGLRGSFLEDLINRTIEQYRKQQLALIQKIPTPITPVRIDQENRHITLAYFEQRSTVDYIGVVQSIPVCFDAKECASDTFALQNIHEHQIEFMKDYEQQGGISFLLIYYAKRNEFYYLRFVKLQEFVERMRNGGRKSFRYDELEEVYFMRKQQGTFVPFLEALQLDLAERE
ncbi:MAG: Holliday junction resolvase RecU [Eubacteriales bacterium]